MYIIEMHRKGLKIELPDRFFTEKAAEDRATLYKSKNPEARYEVRRDGIM